MKKRIERLMKLAERRDLNMSEMNELLKISFFLTSWALEINAKCIMNKQQRTEMVIVMLIPAFSKISVSSKGILL